MAERNIDKVLINVNFKEATSRQSLDSGDSVNKLFGKIKKWLYDLKSVAFSGSYNDLTNKPDSLPANGGNSDTVNNHTVDSDVPANAVFTDTTYSTGTDTTSGLTKLYTSTGTNTDGAMTQKAITEALSSFRDLPIASTTTLGGVQVDGITIKADSTGKISTNFIQAGVLSNSGSSQISSLTVNFPISFRIIRSVVATASGGPIYVSSYTASSATFTWGGNLYGSGVIRWVAVGEV